VSLAFAAAAALASAVALWASSPAVGLGWLAWVALVPVAAVTLAAGGTRRGRLAVPLAYALFLELLLVPALPFGIAADQWGDPVLPVMVGDSPVVFVALVAVPLVALLLYAARFPQPLASRSGLVLVAVPAFAWTALDVLRTKFDPSGFWGPLFLSQHDTSAGALAALAGPWLVTFALVAVNWTVALVLVRRREALRTALVVAGAVAAGVVAVAVVSVPSGHAPERVSVAVVQPGYDTAEYNRPVLRYLRPATRDLERASLDVIDDLAPLTRRAGAEGAALVVWPEATIWVDPAANARVARAVAELADETGAAIVVPFFLRSRAHGATALVLPDGDVLGPQPKQRPMWFLGERGANRTPPEAVETPLGRVGTLLGVDNQDAAVARELAADRATLLASSTHDWRELAPYQRALSQLHARALSVPLARADWRYGSAVYAGGGDELASAGEEKRRAVVVAEVSPRRERTPYARIGDAFAWVAVAGALGLYAAAGVRRRASGR
jgi:apolipoprotein N-acyltransferase